MISPAFSTTTMSPTRTSFRAISSALCRLAWLTVVPASRTGGSKWATGVSLPVLPTWHSMRASRVTACSASNLYARAHRGNLLVTPSLSRWAKSSTLMTMPSVS